MHTLFFVSSAPLLHRFKSLSTCNRRPRYRQFLCSADKLEPIKDFSDDSVQSKLSDQTPNKESDSQPDASSSTSNSKWVYPEGAPQQFDGNKNPWEAWNASKDSPQSLSPRDPKAEIDRWRDAARSIGETVASSDTNLSASASSAAPSSKDVWRLARSVTGEMHEMQAKLKEDLERYNPDENTDQYRDIARELVGPPPEVGDDVSPKRESADLDRGAESGEGWNPDVDWMRFDDVQRELRKKKEKSMRAEVESDARKAWMDNNETIETSDQDSSQDLGNSETFTDQRPSKDFFGPGDKVPGFIRNRSMDRGIYGADQSDADREIEELKKKGIPLRDPKKDTEKWRSVASELNLDFESDVAGSTQLPETVDLYLSEKLEEDISRSRSQALPPDNDESVDDVSSWEMWRKESVTWKNKVENAAPRDPKLELDMWRASARDLTSSTSTEEKDGKAGKSEQGSSGSKQTTNEWDKWRSANEKWESSLSETPERYTSNPWLESGESGSDWGANMSGKGVSDRTVWGQWNEVSWNSSSPPSEWWKTKYERDQLTTSDNAGSNIDQWRVAAKEISLGDDIKLQEKSSTEESKESRLKKNTSISSWRSIARDMISDPTEEE